MRPTSLGRVEIKLDDLSAFLGRREELPFLDGVLASLDQQRMASDHASAANFALGSDHHFDFDFTGYVHPASEFRINRGDFGFNLSLAIVRVRLLGEDRAARKKRNRSGSKNQAGPAGLFRHNPSSIWKIPREEKGTWDARNWTVRSNKRRGGELVLRHRKEFSYFEKRRRDTWRWKSGSVSSRVGRGAWGLTLRRGRRRGRWRVDHLATWDGRVIDSE